MAAMPRLHLHDRWRRGYEQGYVGARIITGACADFPFGNSLLYDCTVTLCPAHPLRAHPSSRREPSLASGLSAVENVHGCSPGKDPDVDADGINVVGVLAGII